MVTIINELIGKTLVNIEKIDNDELIFECSNGEKYKMHHYQDCCEEVYIEDINGNLYDLLNDPLIIAEGVSEEGGTNWGSCTWTFYKFATVKGYVTIRWYGESNGYYSEEVDITKIRE